ncbi:ATP-binding cassette domain-containing protein [Nocardioides soli]|uniref:ABC-2 type transport system ATP-binding protein n=1 Tax=Nocardioides soli TaxID=1036020 RepID=A0A7W4VST8_9ACTN|nr:ATP-binding cassette domain-containing protein [Nocardioides soli]MBB3040858.1 ABC-2 type transport system ATP-binding protein [Nocardioides soli]
MEFTTFPATTIGIAKLSKRYRRGITALSNIEVTFTPGITAVLGRNGAGKSTLVRSIVGIDTRYDGTITFEESGEILGRAERMRRLGWLPQSFGYPARMTTRDFVAYAAWLKGLPRDSDEAIDCALDTADVASHGRQRLDALSGGTLRRVGFAASIVHAPSVLVLDEPTTGLDPIQRAEFHERLAMIGRRSTVVLATHILEDVAALADRVHVIEAGELVWSGTAVGLSRAGGNTAVDSETLRSGFRSVVGGELS